MEYILMSLFGGGICDWQDIAQTKYDWDDIFETARNRWGFDITINCLYETILEQAIEDFNELIKDFINEYKNNENYKKEVEVLDSFDFSEDSGNWDIWCNCLDTHITLFTTAEVIETLEKVALDSDIGIIDDKIGFTSINIEEK